MALVRMFAAKTIITGGLLRSSIDTHKVLLVACKQTIAQQLGLPEPPKRPLVPHLRFLKHYLEVNKMNFPGLTHRELFIKTSQLWKSLAPTEKEKWTCEYEKDKIIYDDRYKKYMSTLIPSQVESIRDLKEKQAKDKIRQGKRREKKKEANMLGKPRYPGNGFTLFMISLDRGETPSKDFMVGVAKLWHDLPQETKNTYHTKAKENLEQYNQELMKWEVKMLKDGRDDLVRRCKLEGELKFIAQSQKHQKQ
nr:transcription factor A, mitochondrial-like [Cherax quadricarinatus]